MRKINRVCTQCVPWLPPTLACGTWHLTLEERDELILGVLSGIRGGVRRQAGGISAPALVISINVLYGKSARKQAIHSLWGRLGAQSLSFVQRHVRILVPACWQFLIKLSLKIKVWHLMSW